MRAQQPSCLLLHPLVQLARIGVGLFALGLDLGIFGGELEPMDRLLQRTAESIVSGMNCRGYKNAQLSRAEHVQ